MLLTDQLLETVARLGIHAAMAYIMKRHSVQGIGTSDGIPVA